MSREVKKLRVPVFGGFLGNDPKRRADGLIKRGDKCFKKDDLDGAEKAYREAAELAPGYAEAHYKLGRVYFVQQDYEAALQSAKRATSANVDLDPAYLLRADSLIKLERYEEALFVLSIIERGDYGAHCAVRMAYCLEQLGDCEQAEEYLRYVLESAPNATDQGAPILIYPYNPVWADLHHALARVLQQLGKNEDAWLHYHLAKVTLPTIELDPMSREIISDADLLWHPRSTRTGSSGQTKTPAAQTQ